MKYLAIAAFILFIACNVQEPAIHEQRAGSITIDSLGKILQGEWQFDSLPGEVMNFEYTCNGKKNYFDKYITINVLWHHKDKSTSPVTHFNIFTGNDITIIQGKGSQVPQDSDFYCLCEVLIIHNRSPRILHIFQIKSITNKNLVLYGGFLSDRNYFHLTKMQ